MGPVAESVLPDVSRKVADIFAETDKQLVKMLNTHRKLLDAIVAALMEKTVLNRDELLELLAKYKSVA